ncbi:MAG: preprotein translocase subunit SecA [Buchnera aphidicola (Periphyllus lyropictus)]|uniref:preprotein translocase subunit SecA n=1 Tax=Buchnera aphidicola TaxID=9 RepID=UPI001EC5D0AB|nr:preprotein translocase subunit SecA [Buchnera aphidicola]NIH16653.1 preprotein translocase subunit SecA [Buchnera aphidicola (Periphyllus lyropictus)]USS94563.1 preprotein translocase subunit SecA [Buchnera aphidicola (Periphyllus lyropictus)]
MFFNFLKKIFGSRNDKILNKLNVTVDKINILESKYKNFSDQKLKENTQIFIRRLKNKETLKNLLVEAYATVREASKRVFGMRHFDVQILGGIVLNNRCIAEMKTGEGKTLTSTLPVYLNSLQGKGVHIITMNDYLAKRDSEKNKLLFEFLGLTVGLNLSELSHSLKKKAYLADITYGTNYEFGFDYLRDNMVLSKNDQVQRGLNYALIDEVDSILIDESRTPLVISGEEKDCSNLYFKINKIVPLLKQQEKEDTEDFSGNGDFFLDEKIKQVYLTEKGLIKIENILVKNNILKKKESLYSSKNIKLLHHVISSLRAHKLFIRDVDYLVKNKEIVIVDEHTGRITLGRRWSDGLHQAIEAKEKVLIKNENKTLASITFQNYFRLYKKLSGMTGTAETESYEFRTIYNLDTVVIPTNRLMIREDFSDLVYLTEKEKISSIIKDIKDCYVSKKPVLVGTISIEKSEIISSYLKNLGIKHNVLNAKFHKKEAKIISQAGKLGAVTIATNMAGRGTDIILGGYFENKNFNHLEKKIKKKMLKKYNLKKKKWKKNNKMVLKAGGLHVIGTERHESRRIDNQLRGRSGRQGDCGSSRFYLSMEDDLMRIFASEKIINIMRAFGMKKGQSIESSWVNKAIFNAQKKVENRNFDIRKQLLEYDDVINKQRKVIYKQRNILINKNDIHNTITTISKDVFLFVIRKFSKKKNYFINKKSLFNLQKELLKKFKIKISFKNVFKDIKKYKDLDILDLVLKKFRMNYFIKEKLIGSTNMRNIEKAIMLKKLDFFWKEHLSDMEYLRQGIHLRGYAQKDPKLEYNRESFIIFSDMLESLKYEVILELSRINLSQFNPYGSQDSNYKFSIHGKFFKKFKKSILKNPEIKYNYSKEFNKPKQILDNDKCYCFSGKKYKNCHKKLDY